MWQRVRRVAFVAALGTFASACTQAGSKPPERAISGRLLDHDQKPFTRSVTVMIGDEGPSAQVGPDGRFRLVFPPRYSIQGNPDTLIFFVGANTSREYLYVRPVGREISTAVQHLPYSFPFNGPPAAEVGTLVAESGEVVERELEAAERRGREARASTCEALLSGKRVDSDGPGRVLRWEESQKDWLDREEVRRLVPAGVSMVCLRETERLMGKYESNSSSVADSAASEVKWEIGALLEDGRTIHQTFVESAPKQVTIGPFQSSGGTAIQEQRIKLEDRLRRWFDRAVH